MSILIKGMEMPDKKNGSVLIIYPDGKCAFEDGKTYQAVPVPPHGRLIDADAIGYAGIEKAAYDSLLIVKEQNKLCEDLELLERANGRLDGVLRITSKLRFAPTVIPAEEG